MGSIREEMKGDFCRRGAGVVVGAAGLKDRSGHSPNPSHFSDATTGLRQSSAKIGEWGW
jgi:hypothetical protein